MLKVGDIVYARKLVRMSYSNELALIKDKGYKILSIYHDSFVISSECERTHEWPFYSYTFYFYSKKNLNEKIKIL